VRTTPWRSASWTVPTADPKENQRSALAPPRVCSLSSTPGLYLSKICAYLGSLSPAFGAILGCAPQPYMEEVEALPRTYTRAEPLGYLEYCRRTYQEIISALSHEQTARVCRFAWGELSFAELQLYNLRHVQEQGAQLRMFLRQQAGASASWLSQAQ
jgi:hypothetical protein